MKYSISAYLHNQRIIWSAHSSRSTSLMMRTSVHALAASFARAKTAIPVGRSTNGPGQPAGRVAGTISTERGGGDRPTTASGGRCADRRCPGINEAN